ncbi:MAG: class I SAM-dependent methyltransferase [Elusimicrobiales bacterium]|nr:class I SAM-dependent methyltransferase [Elusimicrobiales bacterium]
MPSHTQIYKTRAARYDALISREDYKENLPRSLRRAADWRGKDIIELGAGTGRLTLLFAPQCRSIKAFDLSPQMLAIARRKLNKTGLKNWSLAVADNRKIPQPDACADITVSAWSISYLAQGKISVWRQQVDAAITEMKRILRKGGTAIIVESLGTGRRIPAAPNRRLSSYYSYLKRLGFSRRHIRTDYKFKDTAEAAALAEFFFGARLSAGIRKSGSRILPECTGVWHLTIV